MIEKPNLHRWKHVSTRNVRNVHVSTRNHWGWTTAILLIQYCDFLRKVPFFLPTLQLYTCSFSFTLNSALFTVLRRIAYFPLNSATSRNFPVTLWFAFTCSDRHQRMSNLFLYPVSHSLPLQVSHEACGSEGLWHLNKLKLQLKQQICNLKRDIDLKLLIVQRCKTPIKARITRNTCKSHDGKMKGTGKQSQSSFVSYI